jgi:hypothetical protein
MWRSVDFVQPPVHVSSSLADISNLKMEVIRSSETSVQSAATCSRWFLARGLFYPEDGGDTFLRNVDSVYCYLVMLVPHSRIFLPWRWMWYIPPKRQFSLQSPAHAGSSVADFSILNMEAIRSSETSVYTRSTRLHIPEDGILHSHHCENLKSYDSKSSLNQGFGTLGSVIR